jgi:hypothetical protein
MVSLRTLHLLLFCFGVKLLASEALLNVRVGRANQLLQSARIQKLPVQSAYSYSDFSKRTRLELLPGDSALSSLAESLFAFNGHVPIWQAAGLNLVLFLALRKKLLKVLTEEGFWNAFALGTGLWATLGWRGWTLCVGYLIFGSAVTKVRFAEKEELGIAEGRGGRRGPENTW